MVETSRDMKARRILSKAPTGIVITNDDGKIIHESIGRASTNRINIPQSWLGIATSTGGSDSEENDSVGLDKNYSSNSVGFRELLWSNSGSDYKIDAINNITLLKDVGSNLENAYDITQYSISLIRTPIVKGVKGESQTAKLVYDKNNVPIISDYVTKAPLPISINNEDLVKKENIFISLDGVGENIAEGNLKVAPKIAIQFKDDGTINVQSIQGYNLDSLVGENNGVYYDIRLNTINSASILKTPVTQYLPDGMVLYSGSSHDEITLSNVTDGFSNVGAGIEITFSDNLINNTGNVSVSLTKYTNFPKIFRIPYSKLVASNFKVPLGKMPTWSGSPYYTNLSNANTTQFGNLGKWGQYDDQIIIIGNNTIKPNVRAYDYNTSLKTYDDFWANIESVKTYLYEKEPE